MWEGWGEVNGFWEIRPEVSPAPWGAPPPLNAWHTRAHRPRLQPMTAARQLREGRLPTASQGPLHPAIFAKYFLTSISKHLRIAAQGRGLAPR